MPAEFNRDRAAFVPANDYAAGIFIERVKLVLSGKVFAQPETINDAIELYQCKLIVEQHPYFFAEEDRPYLEKATADYFAQACSLASSLLERNSIGDAFDSVELQYISRFWDLVASANLWRKISEPDLQMLLVRSPTCLHDVLQIPAMVKRFDACLCQALPKALPFSAELIIREFGVNGVSNTRISLPSSMSFEVIDELMLKYLESETPNYNYVSVLTKWPSSAKDYYRPSPEVVVLAKRRSKELNEQLLSQGTGVNHTISVTFSAEQKACKSAVYDEKQFILSYGLDWLQAHTDCGTILNNFIYVFEFMSPDGLLSLPAHKYENSTLLETFITRAFDEYSTSTGFDFRQMQAQMALQGYEEILKEEGASIERALDYACNEYIESQFGVSGFSVSLPARDATWLDKCKAMGPEIERVLKAFILYCDKGEIDSAYFPFIDIKLFDQIPSLVKDKYLIPGSSFERRAAVLFHDQSHLAFLQTKKSKHQEFYFHINSEFVSKTDFYDVNWSLIDGLIADGYVVEEPDGTLRPTNRTHVLKRLWDNGGIGLSRQGDHVKQVAKELVEENLAVYSSALFTPDEAGYLNYMFNNARFSNALALRNKYDHADFSVEDPNAAEYQQDYYKLLLVLILIVLKINDDLAIALGTGGVEDFVDWPWVDDSLMG